MCDYHKGGTHKTTVKGTGRKMRRKVQRQPPEPPDPPKPSTITYRPLNKDPVYGAEFTYKWTAGDCFNAKCTQRHITINSPSDWKKKNIIKVNIPDLAVGGSMSFHRRVAPQFLAFFRAAAVRGVASRVLTYDGSFVLRTITKNPRKVSNHSLGTAVDLNANWNPYGGRTAKRGTEGSLSELADLCADFGIYWGDWYSENRDAMHFEVVSVLDDAMLRNVCSAYGVDMDKLNEALPGAASAARPETQQMTPSPRICYRVPPSSDDEW